MENTGLDTSTSSDVPTQSKYPHIFYIVGIITALIIGIAIGYLMPKPGLPKQTVTNSPTPTLAIVPSPTPISSAFPSPEATSKLSFTIPGNWKAYSKNFQRLHFTFLYPPNLLVEDGDQDSGDIYLRSNSTSYAFAIGRLSYYGIPEYVSGGRREWFIQGAQSVNSSLNLTADNYVFTPLDFANGNSYYMIGQGKLVNGQLSWLVEPDTTHYFGIFNGKSVLITDHKVLSHDDTLRIMQSLKVY